MAAVHGLGFLPLVQLQADRAAGSRAWLPRAIVIASSIETF